MATLPEGTVTFLFTDIEGSTRLLQDLGDAYAGVRATHHRLLRAAIAKGTEVGTEGDAFFVAFPVAIDAVVAAVDAQRALASHPWPPGHPVRVRMGLHTGRGTVGPDGYVGLDVHRAARIAAAGHGGQVLLSEATLALTQHELPPGTTARDLGSHRLKDLANPERIAELVIDGLPSDHPPLRTVDHVQTNVRSPLTSFIGRERELEALRRLVDDHRLVTLVGTGGTGKTRLLLQIAATVVPDWPDGVWLVELAPLTDAAQVLPAIARTIGAHEDPGRDPGEVVLDFLRPKRLLLLIDNCEHLVAPVADHVRRVLLEAPRVSVLATSREALAVDGETVFHVPSLAVPPAGEARSGQDIEQAPATRLFIERATAAAPDFAPLPDDLVAIAEICRRLDGIPLAIELAAARVRMMSVADIAERLSDRFRLLTGGARTALPRQQTLEAAIDWSWGLLTDDERRVLRRLAVFAGGSTVEAAAAVALDEDALGAVDRTGDVLDLLGRLVAKSLLGVTRTTPTRYRPLETIRQYARERLLEAGESEVSRTRHLAWYLAFAEASAPRLEGPEMAATLGRLDAERENLQVATDWAFETDLEAACRLCVALTVYARSRSLSNGFETLGRAADQVDRLPDWSTSPLAASVLAAAANASWMVGAASRGEAWAARAIEIARASGDERAVGRALIARALTALFLGRSDGVLDGIEEGAAIAERTADDTALAFTFGGVAQWQAESGDWDAAIVSLERAERAAQRSGNPEVIAFAALGRGRVEGYAGHLDEARRAFAKAIEAYEAIEDDALALVVRSDLAHVLRHNGRTAEAIAAYRETLPRWQHEGNRGALANQVESVALLAAAARPTDAARLLAAGGAIREAAGAPMLVFEQVEVDAALDELRSTLGAAALDAAQRDGRRLDRDAVIGQALDLLEVLEQDLSPADLPGSRPRGGAPGCR
jgi:predicted ATPase/class 3 adenylate cyclase